MFDFVCYALSADKGDCGREAGTGGDVSYGVYGESESRYGPRGMRGADVDGTQEVTFLYKLTAGIAHRSYGYGGHCRRG